MAGTDPTTLPGYVDLSDLGFTSEDEATVEVNIKGTLLRFLQRAAAEEDPEFASLVSDLSLITVRVYTLEDGGNEEVAARAKGLSKRLEQNGWETIVSVRERGEHAYIAIKADGDLIRGLTVIAVDGDGDLIEEHTGRRSSRHNSSELVFVNIVGTIDLDEVWRLGDHFDIDPLDSMRSYQKSPKKKSGKP